MKLSPMHKKCLIVAGVAVVTLLIYRGMKKSAASPVVIGNKTVVTPESTITVGPASVKPASQTFSLKFADSLESLIPDFKGFSNSGMHK